MAKKFDNVISVLEQIIEHWFDKEKLASFVNMLAGLCLQVTNPERNDYLSIDESLYDCIKAYNAKYKNGEDRGLYAVFYPVELSQKQYAKDSLNSTLYNNPKRLHLAVFMLAWFRQHNVEEAE